MFRSTENALVFPYSHLAKYWVFMLAIWIYQFVECNAAPISVWIVPYGKQLSELAKAGSDCALENLNQYGSEGDWAGARLLPYGDQ